MTLRKFTTSMIITGFLFCGGAVQAASYQFGQLLAGNGPTNPHFADLEITDNGSGNWTFTLTALDLNTIFGSSSFIGSMAVDGVKPTSISTDAGGGVTAVNLQNGGGPGGIYDFRYDMINPKNEGNFSFEEVMKKKEVVGIFFNSLCNLTKFISYETRDMFAIKH